MIATHGRAVLLAGLLAGGCTQPCPPAPIAAAAPAAPAPTWILWGYIPNRYAPIKAYTGGFAQSMCESAIPATEKKNPSWSFVCLPETVSPYGRN